MTTEPKDRYTDEKSDIVIYDDEQVVITKDEEEANKSYTKMDWRMSWD